MYPYTAGSTGLAVCIPPLASADGKLLERLADPAKRAEIRAEILNPKTKWEDECQFIGPEGVLLLDLRKPENQKYNGKRLSEVAAGENKDWVDALMDLILSERQPILSAFFLASEDNLRLQMLQPWISIVTDESGHDPEHPESLVHPRSYGTYPRVLGKYVRDERVLTLEDAIRKMTSAPAARLSIRDRGLLREGYRADVVIFDPRTISDRATYENPHQLSVGVQYVFVNGTPVVVDGKHTGAKPGQIVRGPGFHAE
jgi:dihydroorotase/N-acyl-D-amino-acid deacylase